MLCERVAQSASARCGLEPHTRRPLTVRGGALSNHAHSQSPANWKPTASSKRTLGRTERTIFIFLNNCARVFLLHLFCSFIFKLYRFCLQCQLQCRRLRERIVGIAKVYQLLSFVEYYIFLEVTIFYKILYTKFA